MFKTIKNSIPNTITSMNLLSGVVAIIFAFHFSEDICCGMKGYQWAFLCIGASALFDFCDGASARLLHAYSSLGKELDSLSDLVSFGVAPAMLVLNALLLESGGCVLSYAALFIPVMGALRLAKFNIDETQKTTFAGLPIPANAIFWIGYVNMLATDGVKFPMVATVVIIAAVSLMMVVNMRMFSLKFKNFSFRQNWLRFLIIGATVVLVALLGVTGLMWTILLYIVLSAGSLFRPVVD
ncbi:MAG: CDP-alcohol phosphatidyltransferase family protein [Muribaculaceae bacterium]|nr:CDP-alcohol phosphatidyltransferase family protein [Muribaculaceae bacterium]